MFNIGLLIEFFYKLVYFEIGFKMDTSIEKYDYHK